MRNNACPAARYARSSANLAARYARSSAHLAAHFARFSLRGSTDAKASTFQISSYLGPTSLSDTQVAHISIQKVWFESSGDGLRLSCRRSMPLDHRQDCDCLSAEELVTRLVTGLQRCYELFFFHLNLWGVFCSVERLLACHKMAGPARCEPSPRLPTRYEHLAMLVEVFRYSGGGTLVCHLRLFVY